MTPTTTTINAEPAELAENRSAGSASSALIVVVRRCRRRLRLVAAVRYAGISLPAAIVLIETIAMVARPAPTMLTLIATTIIVSAMTAALLAAAVRAPSLRETAVALDHRLRLQDRMVTALQVLKDDDGMARLVVEDAAVQVADLSPSRTFPFESPVHFRAMIAGVVSISALLLVTDVVTSPAWRTDRPRGTGPAGAGGAQQGRRAQPGPNQAVESVAPSPSASNRQPGSAAQVATGGAEPAARERGRTPTGRNAADTRGRSAGAASTPGRDAAGGTGASNGGRGATTEALSPANGAGGVKGEPLQSAPAPQVDRLLLPDPQHDPAYAARHRNASARAQAAIAQERVPVSLTTYVKNYFVAIRP